MPTGTNSITGNQVSGVTVTPFGITQGQNRPHTQNTDAIKMRDSVALTLTSGVMRTMEVVGLSFRLPIV